MDHRYEELLRATGSPAIAAIAYQTEREMAAKHNARAAELRKELEQLDAQQTAFERDAARQLADIDRDIETVMVNLMKRREVREQTRQKAERERALRFENRRYEIAALLRGPQLYDGGQWIEREIKSTDDTVAVA